MGRSGGAPGPTCDRSVPATGALQYQASQVVFEQGAPSDLVYIVEDGQIEIVRQRADGTEELAGSPHRFARPWEQGDGRGG